jgi:hypothetical protein
LKIRDDLIGLAMSALFVLLLIGFDVGGPRDPLTGSAAGYLS